MSKNTKILIVEDEILIADFIEQILMDNNYLNIKKASSYNEAKLEMHHWLPDVILMDINLNDKQTGIELSTEKNNNASVIFLTGQFDRASIQKALLTTPESYLTKPLKKHDLLAAIELSILKKQINAYTFKEGYDMVKLNYGEIIYLKADGNYLHIYSSQKKYTIRLTLAKVLSKLPKEIFKQTHRSYAINITKITRRSTGKVALNDIEIPVSRRYDKVF